MNKEYGASTIAIRIWFFTSLVFGLGWLLLGIFDSNGFNAGLGIIAGIVAGVGSLPVLILLYVLLPIIKKYGRGHHLFILVIACLGFSSIYGTIGGGFLSVTEKSTFLETFLKFTAILFGCSLAAIFISHKAIDCYFSFEPAHSLNESWQQEPETQINTNMETSNYQPSASWNNNPSKSSNKTVVKAIIVAVLTLAMLIPTTLISNMVIERQANNTRQIGLAKDPTTITQTAVYRNYEKIMRTTKYAILVIGLTFSIFFLIELMQKKPVHPVQYTLVGLALAIFYTLLLSIGEHILFDYAYIISAAATITLITLYVKSHFQNWKAASALGGVLIGLYGFILVLVSLEDTALIVGSIGLFIVLAIVMYTTRNINWYNPSFHKEADALS